MPTGGPGIWLKTLTKLKMRNAHCRTWDKARNTEKLGK
jgi:hypothetical protein